MSTVTSIGFDLETAPAPGFEDYTDAALDFNRNQVTLYAFSDGVVSADQSVLSKYTGPLVTHNGKFDFKVALSKPGCPLRVEQYQDDTMLMLVALPHKIPEDYLQDYNEARKALNKALGSTVHRDAGKYSLKTAAPYFLGVERFWEVADHNNTEYAYKDALYTKQLSDVLLRELEAAGTLDFYRDYLMPWSRLLLRMEMRGVAIDMDMLQSAIVEHGEKAQVLEGKLRGIWGEYISRIESRAERDVEEEYRAKALAAVAKLSPSKKKDPAEAAGEDAEKRVRTLVRYAGLAERAKAGLKRFNFASPKQLSSLLKDEMGLDIRNLDDEESTGKEVLEKLLREDVIGIPEFLEWRKSYKLATAFFPSYQEKQVADVIHSNFNLTGTRTGRLSSNSVNLQQVPKSNLSLFIPHKDQLMIYRDASAIEPRLLAYESECYALCKIFLEGSDFHSFNVRTALGIDEDDVTIKEAYKAERDLMKEVGLSLLYGASWKRIYASSRKRGMPISEKECKRMFKLFQETYSDVWEYKAELEKQINNGELITNVLGRPLHYEEGRVHMTSLNTKIQSGASDMVLESARIYQNKHPESSVVMLIHDAIVASSPKHLAQKHFDSLGEIMLSWHLPTRWGVIPLKSEGGVKERLGE